MQAKCCEFCPNNEYIAKGYKDGSIKIYSLSNLKCLGILSGHTTCVTHLNYSPDSKYLISSSE